MELRPLKCCICPKLTPRAQEFRTWKCMFFPSRNKGFPLGRKKRLSQYVFFFKYEMKQNIPFSWNKNNYIHNNRTVSCAPLPAKIISPQIVLSAYRDDPKSIRL